MRILWAFLIIGPKIFTLSLTLPPLMPKPRKRVCTTGPERCPFLELPDEILVHILRWIPVHSWRHVGGSGDVDMPSRVYSVRAVCQRFRDMLDDMVQELWILNTSPYLAMDAVCKKIERCQRGLRRLTLYRVYPGTSAAVQSLSTAIDRCSKLDTICITPGGGLRDSTSYSCIVAPKHVSTTFLIPSGAVFEDTHYGLVASGDWSLFRECIHPTNTSTAPNDSQDSAVACRPKTTKYPGGHGFDDGVDICYREQLRATQRILLPSMYYPRIPAMCGPGRRWLSFNEFTHMVWCPLKELAKIDTTSAEIDATKVAVCLTSTSFSECIASHYLSRIRNIVASSGVLANPCFRSILVAVDHAVTLWVHHSDLRQARGILPPRMSLAPLWDIDVRTPAYVEFVNPLLSALPPHP